MSWELISSVLHYLRQGRSLAPWHAGERGLDGAGCSAIPGQTIFLIQDTVVPVQ